MTSSRWAWFLALGLLTGCGEKPKPAPAVAIDPGVDLYAVDYRTIQFQDDAQTNYESDVNVADLTFSDIDGEPYSIKDHMGDKNLVVVLTRGYSGPICVYCSTLTSRLITNYPKFAERNAEIVVVYPVQSPEDSMRREEFVAAIKSKLDAPVEKLPFQIVLDVELKGVTQLGLKKDLSKPATFILDKQGRLRFAYVGESLADRPSVKALLDQLDALNQNAQAGT